MDYSNPQEAAKLLNPFVDPTTGSRYSSNPEGKYRYEGGSPTSTATPTGALADVEAERYYSGLDRSQPDPNKIFQDTLKNYQGLLDAIGVRYDQEIRSTQPARDEAAGASRAIQASYGVQSSPLGLAQGQKVERQNQQQVDAINADRALAVQSVYANIRSEAVAETKARKAEALGNNQAYLEFLNNQQEKTKANIASLGAKGTTVKDLKAQDPQGFSKLLSILGISESDLDFKLNDYRKQAEKIVWDKPVTLKDGRLMMVGHDPLNPDKPVTKTIDADLPEGSEAVFANVNGVSGVYYKDTSGNLIPASSTQEAGLEKQKTEAEIGLTRAQTSKAYADIEKLNADTQKILNDVEKNTPGAPSELKTTALSAAKDLLKRYDDGQKFAVGGSSLFGTLPGTGARDFVKNFENVKSLLSLDNIKYLKGQGQVSDAERRLLAEASTQLSRDQSEEQFRLTLEGIVKTLGGESTTGSNSADEAYLKQLGL